MKVSEKIISAILTLVLGILFIVLKGQVVSIAMTILGVLLIVLGIMNLTTKLVAPGVVKIVVGALVILFGWVLVSAALYILAALIAYFRDFAAVCANQTQYKGCENYRYDICLCASRNLYRHRLFPVFQSGWDGRLGLYRGGSIYDNRRNFNVG